MGGMWLFLKDKGASAIGSYHKRSDPMAVVYTKGRDGALQELGRTEVVLNSLNPKWIRKHTVTYYFEVVQTLVFRVYDVDTQFDNVDVKV
ncbi:protein BONZAI 2-like [Camellia sinensis]|uniref:protein BONZAI 2-like n=1 Tax=Camellia sinensis TaxID=4442 RepID=UPI001036012C|nr:protein BONZAI 2-like [Camellia sinensis]